MTRMMRTTTMEFMTRNNLRLAQRGEMLLAAR